MNPKRCSCSKSKENPKKEKPKKEKTNTYKKGVLEYVKLKNISYETLMYDFSEDKFCGDFIDDFKLAIETLGINFGTLPFPTLMKTVLEHPKWLDFLKDHDYIAEYLDYDVSIGEIFLVDGQYKMITGNDADSVISLLDLENGELEDAYQVENITDIQELDSLCNMFHTDEDGLAEILNSKITLAEYVKKKK